MKFRRSGKIYIIPTRFGLVFLMSVVAMILAGATYSNNMVNLLAFFLLAIGLVAMVQTHNNIKSVRIQLVNAEPGFAGSTIRVTTGLENTSREPRFNLEVRPERLEPDREQEMLVPLNGHATLRLMSTYKVARRGRHRLEWVRVSTIFPLGLFYSWTWIAIDSTFIVYPEPKGALPLPRAEMDPADTGRSSARGGDDFYGHRRYTTSDSARRVDWKAHARGRPLMIKEFDEGDPQAVLLDWYSLPHHLDTEARLSQLTAWIEAARTRRQAFALRLPHVFIPPGEDLIHHQRCLEELAVYQDKPDDAAA